MELLITLKDGSVHKLSRNLNSTLSANTRLTLNIVIGDILSGGSTGDFTIENWNEVSETIEFPMVDWGVPDFIQCSWMMLEKETGSKYTFESGLFYFKTGFPILFLLFRVFLPQSFSKNSIHPSKPTLTNYYIALYRMKDVSGIFQYSVIRESGEKFSAEWFFVLSRTIFISQANEMRLGWNIPETSFSS